MARREFTTADYSAQAELRCGGCGWSGVGGDASERTWPDFVAVRCPTCDRTLANVRSTLPVPVEPSHTPRAPVEPRGGSPEPTTRRHVAAEAVQAEDVPARPTSGSAYYDFFDGSPVTCASCGWSGPGDDWWTESNRGMDLFDIWCPRCDAKRGFLSFPTHQETIDAAAAGSERATAALPALEQREAFLERASASELTDASDLPDLEGDELELLWDLEVDDDGGDHVTVIRHGERELWRETAYWQGGDRFAAVFTILRRRYGWRLAALVATDESLGYLGGDHFTTACRRAERGWANLDRAQRPVELTLGSVVDAGGRTFHVLRQGKLVLWRAPTPSGAPTAADAARLEDWARHQYRADLQVTLEG